MTNTNDDLDSIILSSASADWQKTALLISKVFDALKAQGKDIPAQAIAERIYVLADAKSLTTTGNIRRWRDSNVRVG